MKNATEEKPENMKQVPGQQRLPAVLQERDAKEGGIFLLSCGTEQSGR